MNIILRNTVSGEERPARLYGVFCEGTVTALAEAIWGPGVTCDWQREEMVPDEEPETKPTARLCTTCAHCRLESKEVPSEDITLDTYWCALALQRGAENYEIGWESSVSRGTVNEQVVARAAECEDYTVTDVPVPQEALPDSDEEDGQEPSGVQQ